MIFSFKIGDVPKLTGDSNLMQMLLVILRDFPYNSTLLVYLVWYIYDPGILEFPTTNFLGAIGYNHLILRHNQHLLG